MKFEPRSVAAFLIALLCALGSAVVVQRMTGPAYARGEAPLWPALVLPPLVGLGFFSLVYGVLTGGAPSARFWFLAPVIIVALVALAFGAIYMGYATPVEAITLLFCVLAVIGGLAYGRRKPLP